MIRLLLTVFLAYMFFRILKGVLSSGQKIPRGGSSAGAISEMVQDPFCSTYIPKNEAFKTVIGGKEIFFCSRECADKYKNKVKS